ncbi:MAG: DUF6458 family protein [Actinomycetota bacterium]|nr:DUF6458 family protein [Actinomycetota bacterium]
MTIGGSIGLIALGAILAFAVNLSVYGLELDTVGVILMVAGAIGLVATLVMWGGWSRPGPVVEEVYVDEPPVAGRRIVRRGF